MRINGLSSAKFATRVLTKQLVYVNISKRAVSKLTHAAYDDDPPKARFSVSRVEKINK